MPTLDALADALASALRRRHALDELARAGDAVPAALLHAAEAEIRAAELAVICAARAGAPVRQRRRAFDWACR